MPSQAILQHCPIIIEYEKKVKWDKPTNEVLASSEVTLVFDTETSKYTGIGCRHYDPEYGRCACGYGGQLSPSVRGNPCVILSNLKNIKL